MRSIRLPTMCLASLCLGLAVLMGCATRSDAPDAAPAAPTPEAAAEAVEPADAEAAIRTADALCQIPSTSPSPQGSLAEFADYSWRLFVALNWPAETGSRGTPDCDAAFGQRPTVWETYKTTEQTFLTGAKDPGPWDAGEMGQPTLFYRSKVPQGLPVENSIRQAVGGWLIDQGGHPTYYQIGLDEESYDYIRQNQYYDKSVVSQAASIDFPDGSAEIKAAWKILASGDSADDYLHRKAELMIFDDQGNPTGQTKVAKVGLVGFHAIYKAKGFPQWIWTTFEHRRNAPTDGPSTEGQRTSETWTYFDADCTGEFCTPNVSPLDVGQPFGSPNQLTRITPLEDAVNSTNAIWTAKPEIASTAFANYELISPQWPTAPNDPGQPQGSPTPSTVANITLESYIQPTSSCMDCHSTARVPGNAVKSNYSFVFLFAQNPSGGAS